MDRLAYAKQTVKKFFGYEFRDEKLLLEAITHASYFFEHKSDINYNERLEFLGDSVLGLVISDYLFLNYPLEDEGFLTKIRKLVVCEQSLNLIARDLSWDKALLLGRGEENDGGRNRPSNLANAVEALLAALYLENGFREVSSWIIKLFKPYIDKALEGSLIYDYKTKLFEYIQAKLGPSYEHGVLDFVILDETGPMHNLTFELAVRYQGKVIAKGRGKSKKEAEQQASKEALHIFGIDNI